MKALAVFTLTAWVIGSMWFATWKKNVVYPSRPAGIGVVISAYELSLLALCLWVVFS